MQVYNNNENGEFNFVVRQPGIDEIVIQPLSLGDIRILH